MTSQDSQKTAAIEKNLKVRFWIKILILYLLLGIYIYSKALVQNKGTIINHLNSLLPQGVTNSLVLGVSLFLFCMGFGKESHGTRELVTPCGNKEFK